MVSHHQHRTWRTQTLTLGWPWTFASFARRWQGSADRPEFDHRLPLPAEYPGQDWTFEWLGVFKSWRSDNALREVWVAGGVPFMLATLAIGAWIVAARLRALLARNPSVEHSPGTRRRRLTRATTAILAVAMLALLFPRVQDRSVASSNSNSWAMRHRLEQVASPQPGVDPDVHAARIVLEAVQDAERAGAGASPVDPAQMSDTVIATWSYRYGFSCVHLTWPTQTSFAHTVLGWRWNTLLPAAGTPGSAGAPLVAKTFPADSWRFATTNWNEREVFFPVAQGDTSRFSLLVQPGSFLVHFIGCVLAIWALVRLARWMLLGRDRARWRRCACVRCGYDLRGVISPAERSL